MKRVAIMGLGDGWKNAPLDMDRWTLNVAVFQTSERIDLHFEIHAPGTASMEHWELMAKAVKDCCQQRAIPLFSNENFPWEKYIEHFDTDFYSCTICHMIAHAIYEGYNEIHLYGANFREDHIDADEKAGVDFWCGMAKSRGIKVVAHGNSKVMRTPDGMIYGYGKPQKGRDEE